MTDPHAALAAADRRHLIHPLHHPVDSRDPVVWVGGEGSTLIAADGRRYIDGLSGLWNVNVGHGRRELVEAASAQMRTLAYCSGFAGSSSVPPIRLAERLVALTGGAMDAVFFTCGGAEANESAFKTARFYWKARGMPEKVKVIARDQGYHGLTLQTMSATAMGRAYWQMFEPRVPGFVHVPTCYPYRYQGAPGETAGQAAARALEETILREGAGTVAAFVAEPIHGAGGIVYPTDDYWPLVRDICTRHDILLVADEIITGFGRTGRWFGLSHWNVTADIVTFAKGVTSGYVPLGGMMVSRAIREAMDAVAPRDRWMHAYTYSGHPVSSAVALANLDVIERDGLLDHAADMGRRLVTGLQDTLGDLPFTGEVRGGLGLMAAVELVEDRASKRNLPPGTNVAAALRAGLMQRGVFTRTRPSQGPHPAAGDVVFFAPPLVVTADEIDRLVSAARDAAEAVAAALC